ncbi:MAG: hypothetical protein H0V54_13605 [Chthoniobacterales bacterium]|nr:hypothetical protein [Chthoniobacterales bacterium]
MKTVPFGIAGVAAATGLLLFSSSARAQDDVPEPIVSRAISATIDYGNDAIFQPAKHYTDFERFGLRPQQTVTITVAFPVELAGQLMLAEPLDAGTLALPEEGLIVDGEGKVTLQFQAGDAFGACRVSVHQPDDSNFVQFWVVDPAHPENTPPDLPGDY